MKLVQEYCSICESEQAMPVVQEDENHPGLIWVQCPGCQEIKPMETASAKVRMSSASKGRAGTGKMAEEAKRVVRHYRAGEAFDCGEWIYHPEWNDTGQVTEKKRSSGGHDVIVVSFEKLGEKKLVSNFAK